VRYRHAPTTEDVFACVWHGLAGPQTAPSCVEHRTDDKNIYQRRLPGPGTSSATFRHCLMMKYRSSNRATTFQRITRQTSVTSPNTPAERRKNSRRHAKLLTSSAPNRFFPIEHHNDAPDCSLPGQYFPNSLRNVRFVPEAHVNRRIAYFPAN
jgi:hypothetical protein